MKGAESGNLADLVDDRLNQLRELKAFAWLECFVVPHRLIKLRIGERVEQIGQHHL